MPTGVRFNSPEQTCIRNLALRKKRGDTMFQTPQEIEHNEQVRAKNSQKWKLKLDLNNTYEPVPKLFGVETMPTNEEPSQEITTRASSTESRPAETRINIVRAPMFNAMNLVPPATYVPKAAAPTRRAIATDPIDLPPSLPLPSYYYPDCVPVKAPQQKDTPSRMYVMPDPHYMRSPPPLSVSSVSSFDSIEPDAGPLLFQAIRQSPYMPGYRMSHVPHPAYLVPHSQV